MTTKYGINPKTTWEYDRALKAVAKENEFVYLHYRPFDTRYVFYNHQFLSRSRKKIMDNLFEKDNLGLGFCRQVSISTWQHCLVTNSIMECCYISNKGKERGYLAPLYLYEEKQESNGQQKLNNGDDHLEKTPNFKEEFLQMAQRQFGKDATPENILGYIYAVMHCPHYRQQYIELLKIDFPRIPFNVDKKRFMSLANIGWDLIQKHTLKVIPDLKIGSCISKKGFDNITVERLIYDQTEEKIYLSDDKDIYFEKVPISVWQFTIGGYQVLDKYLKYRKDRILSHAEIKTLSNIVKVLGYTLEKMNEIKKYTQ